ncbi:MAG TPA: MGMT family protein [Terriglobales bacterium]|jgi:methylated-DNA-protein-cysteine methyltransferase-like protein|nr:MGMT family protein [Terriglobales bacterium]
MWDGHFVRRFLLAKARMTPMETHIVAAIRRIPRGKVSTYGAVARGAGYPGNARRVAAVLHNSGGLPWQRVLGAGGEIKLQGDYAFEQKFRLQSEGVTFRGKRVNMRLHEFKFPVVRSKKPRATPKKRG